MAYSGGFQPGGNQNTNTGFSFAQASTPATSTMTSSSGLFSGGITGGQPPASSQQQSSGLAFNMKPQGGMFGSQTPSAIVSQSQPSAFGGGTQSGFSFGGLQTTSTSATSTTGFSLGGGATAAPASIHQQNPAGFSFSATSGFGGQAVSSGAGGFSFGQTPRLVKTTPAFNIGGAEPLTGGSNPFSTASAPGLGSGFNFAKSSEQPVSTTTATSTGIGGFKLGAGQVLATQSTQPSTMGLGFGTGMSSSVGGFSLAASTVPTPQSTGFSLAASTVPTPQSTGSFTPSSSSFTAPRTTVPTTTASGFGFGFGNKLGATTSTTAATSIPTTTASGFGFGNKLGVTASTTAATSTAAPVAGAFSLGGKTSSTFSGLNSLGSTATSTASTTSSSITSGFKLGEGFRATTFAPPASTSSGSLKSTASGSLTKGFKLGGTSTATTTTTAAVTAATSATTTMTTTMKYFDLEAKVNSWMSELEQQEKLFLTQATHVNAWNKLLIENADKITNLNTEFENVELSQKRLNAESDYIKTQQNELEELLKPLEEKTKQHMAALSLSVHTHHADIERERTYNLAENIDSQLKNMAQDLREVVEHINSTTAPADASNSVFQIGKILSAHMDSLQWLDSNSASLHLKVQEMTEQVDQIKREHETKFRLAFN